MDIVFHLLPPTHGELKLTTRGGKAMQVTRMGSGKPDTFINSVENVIPNPTQKKCQPKSLISVGFRLGWQVIVQLFRLGGVWVELES